MSSMASILTKNSMVVSSNNNIVSKSVIFSKSISNVSTIKCSRQKRKKDSISCDSENPPLQNVNNFTQEEEGALPTRKGKNLSVERISATKLKFKVDGSKKLNFMVGRMTNIFPKNMEYSDKPATINTSISPTCDIKNNKGEYNFCFLKQFGPKPSASRLASIGFGKASTQLSFTSDVVFEHILVPVLKSEYLAISERKRLESCHPLYAHLTKSLFRCKNIDFSDLRQNDPNFNDQKEISLYKKLKMMSALFFYDMRIASVIRYIGGTYTGAFRDVTQIISDIEHIVPPELIRQIRRLYTVGAPTYFNGNSTRENFLAYWRYGNHSSIVHNPALMCKAKLKEDKHRFALPLPCWLARFIPHLHVTPEGILLKPGKNDRIIFDASFKVNWNSQNVNMWMDPEREPPICYGTTFLRHLTRIWNLRITYKYLDIYLWDDDIAGAFRLIKYNPEIAAAFAAIVQKILWVPTGQVFGSNTSPQNFEAVANTREVVAEFFSSRKYNYLIDKHKLILDKVQFEQSKSIEKINFVQAVRDIKNQGVLDSTSEPVNTPHFTFVDDNHMADIGIRIKQAMAASIEAIFIVFGKDAVDSSRRSALSLEKYFHAKCSYVKVQLGNLVDTRRMIVTHSEDKIIKFRNILSDWHEHRRSFTLKQASILLGNLEYMATWAPWLRYMAYALRHSMLVAMRSNRQKVYNDEKMSHFLTDASYPGYDWQKLLKKDFAVSKIAKEIWALSTRFHFNRSMKEELELLRYVFVSPKYTLYMPIAHVVDRVPEFTAWGDACLDGAGGYCPELKFWFFLEWPDFVKNKTLKAFQVVAKIDRDVFISINLLEYVTIIILYAAATQLVRDRDMFFPHKYPIIRIMSDNTSAVAWTRKVAISTEAGKALGRIFSYLQINNNLGIKADHVAGVDNDFADQISRLTTSSFSISKQELFAKYPEINTYNQYLPGPETLSIIWSALRSGKTPKWGPLKLNGHVIQGTNIG